MADRHVRVDGEPIEDLQTIPDKGFRPLITGPAEATITGPSGRVYDLRPGIIEIDPDDFAYVVQQVIEHYRGAAYNDPGSWCGDGERHDATTVKVDGEIVNWICEKCLVDLTKNAHGWWTEKPKPRRFRGRP